MNNKELKKLISEYQNHDMKNFEEIYKNFSNLIYYYANRIGNDDAAQELSVFFVDLLFKIKLSRFKDSNDLDLQSYIAVCIRNKYILISEKTQKYNNLNSEFQDGLGGYEPTYDDRISVLGGLSIMNSKQRKVLIAYYYYNYSDIEIARMMNISRQSVNKLRNHGLQFLRKYFSDK